MCAELWSEVESVSCVGLAYTQVLNCGILFVLFFSLFGIQMGVTVLSHNK